MTAGRCRFAVTPCFQIRIALLLALALHRDRSLNHTHGYSATTTTLYSSIRSDPLLYLRDLDILADEGGDDTHDRHMSGEMRLHIAGRFSASTNPGRFPNYCAQNRHSWRPGSGGAENRSPPTHVDGNTIVGDA